jgi:hypothetical protein
MIFFVEVPPEELFGGMAFGIRRMIGQSPSSMQVSGEEMDLAGVEGRDAQNRWPRVNPISKPPADCRATRRTSSQAIAARFCFPQWALAWWSAASSACWAAR